MATALLKFTQGALVGDGEALKVLPGIAVTVENSDDTGVASAILDLHYVPPGSSVAIAVPLAQNPAGPVAPTLVTPDSTPGCYRHRLRVYSGAGYTGVVDEDIRNIGVPDPVYDFIFPPYQEVPAKLPVTGSGLPGAKPDELNFGGQPYGWDGFGDEGLLLDFLRQAVEGMGFSYKTVPAGRRVIVPEHQQMVVSGGFTLDGELVLDGELALIP
jgi:hypothetical protein